VSFPDRILTPLSASVRRLHKLLTKFSLPTDIGLSIIFSSLSITFHFVKRNSLAEFLGAVINIDLGSSLSRRVLENPVVRLQRNGYDTVGPQLLVLGAYQSSKAGPGRNGGFG
jgi:hypothetical protein